MIYTAGGAVYIGRRLMEARSAAEGDKSEAGGDHRGCEQAPASRRAAVG